MNSREKGFLLLTSHLSDPQRNPLSVAQLRVLTDRVAAMRYEEPDRELNAADLSAIGYGGQMAQRILGLLDQEDVLEHYLNRGKRSGCAPITRVSQEYPLRLRKKLGADSPGCLWAKGDTRILQMPKVALVGSRDICPENRRFAETVGIQAAKQGYALVSGNARGADRAAQRACLLSGGWVISVVADELCRQPLQERILYLSEDDFDAAFSSQRALSRNRVIHGLADRTFVAQCNLGTGGTWDGTVKNLRFGWSDVFCFRDESEASVQLAQMGAVLIEEEYLSDFEALKKDSISFFDQ